MSNQEITQKAIDQVRDNNIVYYENALSFATDWVKNQFKPFTSEDLKNAFYNAGNTPPAEPRVFGAVIRKLSKDKLISHNGYKKSNNPTCHSRPQSIWISIEYSMKQQQNRKTNYPSLFN